MGWRRGTLAVLGVLVALLAYDATRLPERWVFPRPVVAHDLASAADAEGRARMLNAIVGAALRDVAAEAGAPVPKLEVPEDLDELLDVPADEFGGRPQSTLNPSLMGPLLRGRVATADYDPALLEVVVEMLDRDPRVVRYPRDVNVVRPEGLSEDALRALTYRIFVDPTRKRVFLVPLAEGATP